MTTSSGAAKPSKYKPGHHPNSRKNLLPPYQPGENGQLRSGRAGGYSLTARLKDQLDKPLETPGEDATAAELLIHSTIVGAMKREPTPFREVWERVDGKVEERHAILGDILIEVTFQHKKEPAEFHEAETD